MVSETGNAKKFGTIRDRIEKFRRQIWGFDMASSIKVA